MAVSGESDAAKCIIKKTSMAKAKKVTTKVIKVEAPKATTSGTPITANEVIQNWDKNKEKYCQSAGLDKSISNEDAFIICVQKARYGILK